MGLKQSGKKQAAAKALSAGQAKIYPAPIVRLLPGYCLASQLASEAQALAGLKHPSQQKRMARSNCFSPLNISGLMV